MEKVIHKKHADSDAFRIEYSTQVNEKALRKDIESYLGEYRFRLPQNNYHFMYAGGQLKAAYDDESMIEKGMRAIQRRRNEGRNTSREEAELKGLFLLEKQLDSAATGHSVIWASPPGPREDGYGNYGFLFVGQVQETGDENNKRVNMTAYRLENPKLGQFNEFIETVTGHHPYFETAEEFLSSPQIIEAGNRAVVEVILKRIFRFENDRMKEKNFIRSLRRLSPHIEEFISMVKNGAPKNKLRKVFNAIENYALDSQASYSMSFEEITIQYNYRPPTVAGSCGSSGGLGVGSIFQNTSLEDLLSSGLDESEHYDDYNCPHCNKTLSGERKDDRSSWRRACDHCGGKLGC